MAHVQIYLTSWCPFCRRAKTLLAQRGVQQLEEIDIDDHPEQRQIMMERSGRRTVPQIFIGGRHIGGSDDLAALDERGELVSLLGA